MKFLIASHPRRRRLALRPERGFGFVMAVWCSFPSQVWADVPGEEQSVSCSFQFQAPQFETNGPFIHLTIPGGGQLHKLGQPAMPFRTVRLLVPSGCTVEKAEAEAMVAPQPLEGSWRVEFAGEPHNRPGRGKGLFTPDLNRHVYNSDDLYPASPVELLSVQRMAGYDIALLRLFPVQYRPASDRLVFTPEWRVRLRLSPAATNAPPPLCPPDRRQARRRVAGFVDNPKLLDVLDDPAARAPASAGSSAGSSCDYLLITSSNLAPEFARLVEQKTQDGLSVKVATVEAITNSIAGRDAPERIRNYIKKAYTNWGINYVLLGGATSIVPARDAYVRTDLPPADSYLPCDLYYACLDGSWNANGDRHWGEPTDGDRGGDVDLLAEVFVGRAPVSTPEQVRIFVEKTIRIETQSHPNPTNALLMATYLGEFPTGPCQGADMFQGLLPLLDRWSVTRLDDAPQKMPLWGRAEAVSELNRSPYLALYNGHGNSDILMRMRTPDLTRLTNQWPFLFCSVGCSAGEFDHGKFWPDSFGESLVNGGPHGAFAAVVNARAGWFDPQYPWKYSGEFQVKFFEALLHGHPNLGMALQIGKEDLLGEVETNGCMTYRWCYYEMTLLGDPHLAIQSQGAARHVSQFYEGRPEFQAPADKNFPSSLRIGMRGN